MTQPDLIRRRLATEKTMAKFRSRAFDWKAGATCVHLARFHLRAMGHRVETLPTIRGPIGAARALKERGWDDVAAMLDGQASLMRIAPLQMLVGDLAVLPADEGFDAVVICVGRHKLLGWHQDYPQGLTEMEAPLDALIGAWKA